MGAEIEKVGARGTSRRLAGEALGGLDVAPASQQLRAHAPPAHLCVDVLRRREALGGPSLGQQQRLIVASLQVERVGERRRGAREIAQLADLLEHLAGRAQRTLGSRRVCCEQFDVAFASGCLHLGERALQAEFLGQRPCSSDEVARRIEAPKHRLERGATCQRSSLEPAVRACT